MTAVEPCLAVGWFACYAAFTRTIVRMRPARSPAAIAVLGALAFVAATPLVARLAAYPASNYWVFFAFCNFLILCYLMVLGATYKSVSLRLIAEVQHSPAGLPESTLYERYVESESFAARIDAMLQHGFARLDASGIVATDAGRKLARVVSVLHRLYNIREHG